MKKTILFILSSGLIIGCINQKTDIEILEVYYLPKGTTTDIPIDCKHLFQSLFDKDLMSKSFTNRTFIRKFGQRLSKLKKSDEPIDMDIRIRLMIHYYNKQTDTLCLGEYFGSYLNGERTIDDPNLLRMIKKEIWK